MNLTRTLLIKQFLVLLGLSAFGIGIPLISKLTEGLEFFVAHKTSAFELIAFICVSTLLVPSVLGLIELITTLFSRRFGRALHYTFVWVLALIIFLGLIQSAVFFLVAKIAAACLAAALLCWLYIRKKPVQQLLQMSALFVAVPFALVFTNRDLQSGILRQVSLPVAARPSDPHAALPPIVMLILDEFPLTGLLDASGAIDAVRFPNFAWLAQHSTWMQDITAMSTHTALAVPAILSGRRPDASRPLPTAVHHPVNLFTLLRESYTIHSQEWFTQICPRSICEPKKKVKRFSRRRFESLNADAFAVLLRLLVPPEMGLPLPEISVDWKGFWGEGKKKRGDSRGTKREFFRRFVRQIEKGATPTFHFLHCTLPHMPYQYYPSGERYSIRQLPLGYAQEAWVEDDWLIAQGYQQFLMQLAFSDKLLGELLKQLRTQDLLDQSLLIVTADHGASFRPFTHRRSDPTHPSFFEDVMRIPLFIKLPQQTEGKIDARKIESIDIAPTILDILNLSSSETFDGRSFIDPGFREQTNRRLALGAKKSQRRKGDLSKEFLPSDFPTAQDPSFTMPAWKAAHFCEGKSCPAVFRPILAPDLIGTPVDMYMTIAPDASIKARLQTPKLLWYPSPQLEVKPRGDLWPGLFIGYFKSQGSLKIGDMLALSLGDTIVAQTRVAQLSADAVMFQFLVEEEFLPKGTQAAVQIYKIQTATPGTIQLSPIGFEASR
jgi:hypothetical protein